MRIPLKESVWRNDSGFHNVTISGSATASGSLIWNIDDLQLNPVVRAIYDYAAGDDKNKFFEDGRVYNADGSVADNELISRTFYFNNFSHASLNKILEQPVARFQYNFMYNVPLGENINVKRIAVIRDRLKVPDWVALLVFAKIVEEEAVSSLVAEIPDLFESYPVDWVLRTLGVEPDDINRFGTIDDTGFRLRGKYYEGNYFHDFCKNIELERQHNSSASKIGRVVI